MKKFVKLAIGTVAALALCVALQPAQAACGGAPQITNSNLNTGELSHVFSAGSEFQNFPGSGACYTYGCYGSPFGDDLAGFFWRLGSGDPAVGPGDDNGSYDVTSWLANDFIGTYFYPGGVAGSWNLASDGCLDGGNGSFDDDCMCLLLTDSWEGTGYFALMTGAPNGIGDTSFWQAGNAPLVLSPLPKVEITGSTRLPNFDVQLDVRVSSPSAGVYASGGCDCGPISYKVYEQVVARGAAAPDSRDLTNWNEVAGDTAVDAGTTVTSACGGADQDVYLTGALTFEDGFSTAIVSGNSTRVECGPNLATPEEIHRPVRLPSRSNPRKGGARR